MNFTKAAAEIDQQSTQIGTAGGWNWGMHGMHEQECICKQEDENDVLASVVIDVKEFALLGGVTPNCWNSMP